MSNRLHNTTNLEYHEFEERTIVILEVNSKSLVEPDYMLSVAIIILLLINL